MIFFSFIFLVMFLSIPVLLWGYFVSYLSYQKKEKTSINSNFYFWIFSWASAIVPLFFIQKFFLHTQNQKINIFSSYAKITDFVSIFQFFWLFVALLISLLWVAFIILCFKFFLKKKSLSWKYFFFFFALSIVIVPIFISIFLFLLKFTPESLGASLWNSMIAFWITLSGFAAIFMFYLFSAYLEESLKFFHFLHNYIPSEENSQKNIFFIVVSVALGFTFFENILYVLETYISTQSLGKSLWVGTLRSIFSTSLHISSAIIFSWWAVWLLSKYKNEIFAHWSWKYFFVSMSFILGTFFHTFFNVFIASGMIGILVLFLIAGYFIIVRAFYDPHISQNEQKTDDTYKNFIDIYADNPYA